MKNLYLIRGVPGSGKTTLAEILATQVDGFVFSADDYFMVDGEYRFDATKLKQAHESCQNDVWYEMQVWGAENIFVANTFTREFEMQPYFNLAKEFGYQVFTIVVENRHGSKNVHNVPDDKITQMKNRFEVVL